MSSGYLTSKNMAMIKRLLTESREYPRCKERETEKARFLIGRFQSGVAAEGDLRELLNSNICEADERGAIRWFSAKGAADRIFGALFRSKFSARKPSLIVAKVFVPRMGLNEAHRRLVNDTDGRRRREDELKSRNQMH
jgi:hypothetical protein